MSATSSFLFNATMNFVHQFITFININELSLISSRIELDFDQISLVVFDQSFNSIKVKIILNIHLIHI